MWALLTAAGNLGHVVAGPLLLGLNGGSSTNWKGIMRGAGGAAVVAAAGAWALTKDTRVITPDVSGKERRDGSALTIRRRSGISTKEKEDLTIIG